MKVIAALALILVACSGAEQKPEKKWDVKVTTKGEPKVWVSKADGSKQCGEEPASLTPEGTAQELKRQGIVVFQFRNGTDGMMHTAVCGAPTGNTVELEVAQADLPKAMAKGFKPLKRQN